MIGKYKIIIFAIVISIVVIISSSYILLREDHDYVFYYDVKVVSQGISANYTLIVPMPDFQEDKDNWTNILVSDSIKQGNMTVTMVNTEYGKGLMINSSTSFRFHYRLNESVPAESLTLNPIGSYFQMYAYNKNACLSYHDGMV
jgi:hypothetical protein